MSEVLEVAEALINFFLRQALYAFSAELFNVERRHHRSKNHRATYQSIDSSCPARLILHWAPARARRAANPAESFRGRQDANSSIRPRVSAGIPRTRSGACRACARHSDRIRTCRTNERSSHRE